MFTENEIRNIMFQVLSGMAFVHKHGKMLCPPAALLSIVCVTLLFVN